MVNFRLTSGSLPHLPPPSKETQKKPTPGKEKKRLERWREREKEMEIENRKDLKDGGKGEKKRTQRKEGT
jgi:hypothetical protein